MSAVEKRGGARGTTVAASLAIDLVGHLATRGHAKAEVCRAAGLDPALLDAPDERLAGSVMERLWTAAESLTGDADVGLHAAASYNPGALSILGYVIWNCRTPLEALAKLVRYAAILNDGLRVTVTQDEALTSVDFEALAGLDNHLLHASRQPMETLAAGTVCTLGALTQERFVPREISFRHPSPGATAEHVRILGVAPRFGRPLDRVVFATGDLERPVRSANASLLCLFERHADDMLATIASHGPIGRRVLEALAKRLRGGAPPLPRIARALSMSTRNLQRALQQEGATYQGLLDEARRELALRHLASPEGSAAEVAFLLGFADASAFTRAFRRWTGSTPGAFRARKGAGAVAGPRGSR